MSKGLQRARARESALKMGLAIGASRTASSIFPAVSQCILLAIDDLKASGSAVGAILPMVSLMCLIDRHTHCGGKMAANLSLLC